MPVGRRRAARLRGWPPSGGCGAAHREREGCGRGGARGEGSRAPRSGAAETRPRPPQSPEPGRRPQRGRGPASRPPAAGDPGREGQEGGQPARTGGSEGPRGPARRRRGFPGLGGRRLSSSRAVTASDVPRPRRARRGRAEGQVSGRAESFAHETAARSQIKKPISGPPRRPPPYQRRESALRGTTAARLSSARPPARPRAGGAFGSLPRGQGAVAPAPRCVQRDPRTPAGTAPRRGRPPLRRSPAPRSPGPAALPRRRRGAS